MAIISLEKFKVAAAKYLAEVERNLLTGAAKEMAYRPALYNLLNELDPRLMVLHDSERTEIGQPDFIVSSGLFPKGYVEAKDIGVDLDEIEKTDQFHRYLGLQNLVVTDYLEFRWYVLEELRPPVVRIGTVNNKKRIERNDKGIELLYQMLDSFCQRPVPSVRTPKELASRMARLAQNMVEVIKLALQIESESGSLHKKLQGFRKILLHGMKEYDFADMYAQTIVYGFFAARCNHTGNESFSRFKAATELPKTNPFLRSMFQTFSEEDSTLEEEGIDWLINDLVDLLREAKIDEIMYGFGLRTGKEDPVIYFYETFLKAYNPKLKFELGVFYTPDQVVGYIVRSVDHLLKRSFGMEQGLADTTMIEVPRIDDPQKNTEIHKVLILDPATGTGTFLHHVVNEIFEKYFANNAGMWSGYVSEHLLPRLFGFERIMAPYTIAHMKLGIQLKALGYDFRSSERLRVFLTNTLEAATFTEEALFADWLSKEANAASDVKLNKPVMVIMGNPPYKGHSQNPSKRKVKNQETGKTKTEYTEIGNLLLDYQQIGGQSLGERNPKWLQNDYVKFIRYGQAKIDRVGYGILAMITANSYLDSPTFRGMRYSLLNTFDELHILNLHGNSKKGDVPPEIPKDENVFDITEDVAIVLFVKRGEKQAATNVYYSDLWGPRSTSHGVQGKYEWLAKNSVASTEWATLHPKEPYYLFIPQDLSEKIANEYLSQPRIKDIFAKGNLGFQTHRDPVAVAFTREELRIKVRDYLGNDYREEHFEENAHEVDYRPFDIRWAYLGKNVCDRPRAEIMRHLMFPNIALNVVRQTKKIEWNHAIVSKRPTPALFVEIKDGSTVFPLWRYPDSASPALFDTRQPNLTDEFVSSVRALTNLAIGAIPDASMGYIYALFYSVSYRTRFSELLKGDFPRIPVTSNIALFKKLSDLGSELIDFHVMRKNVKSNVKFSKRGSGVVTKVGYDPEDQRVFINEAQYFEGVSPAVWEFKMGGYQVAEKWLKDRKERTLTYDDLQHYINTLAALNETMRLMKEIDTAIEKHGGWPIQ